MRLTLLSFAILPLALAPLGCSQPAGQVSDQSGEYSGYYEATGNEETAADQAPKLEQHEVHRESLDAADASEEMMTQNEAAPADQEEAPADQEAAPAKEEAAKVAADEAKSEEAEVKPEEVAEQQVSTFKDESPEQSEHVDPPQSALEVSLAEVEAELNQAKQTLQKYSTQQEKKDFRNGAQKLLDENLDSYKPLQADIARLKADLHEKEQRLEAITMLTDAIQDKIDQLDPTSAEPDAKLRKEIQESLSQLRYLQSENDRRVAQQN